MKLAGAVIVEDLSEDAGMAVEKVFIEDRVVISQTGSQPREPGGGYLFQGVLISLVPDPTDVEYDSVLGIHEGESSGAATCARAADGEGRMRIIRMMVHSMVGCL